MNDLLLANIGLETQPVGFRSDLTDSTRFIHRGVFSNDLAIYYYVVSKRDFTEFDILQVEKDGDTWTEPRKSVFSSEYEDHGISFSPSGDKAVFSSTRPVPLNDISNTWHIWMSKRIDGNWSDPIFIEIPNLNEMLISHPSLAPDGTLYFHVSERDYSNMGIYYSKFENGVYQNAERLEFSLNAKGYCTPYISASGKYLMFAAIGEYLDLYYCINRGGNKWSVPTKLPSRINQFGQGNPYLTPNEDFLLYANETSDHSKWSIQVVSTKVFLDESN